MMQQDSPKGRMRQILAFPEINTFYNYLMDRLEMILWRYYLRQDKPFYLFINALPRDHEPVGEIIEIDRFNVKIKNVGVEKLRELKEEKRVGRKIPELHAAWDKLAGKILSIQETVVGRKVFDEFNREDFDLKDIASPELSGNMNDYFAKVRNNDPSVNEITKAEFDILSHESHLGKDIGQYNYISLPLIQFGEIDGVVYIIYYESDKDVFFKEQKGVLTKDGGTQKINKKNIKDIIRRFSDEYERIFVEWYYVYIIYHQKKLPYREGSIGKATDPGLPTYSNRLFSEEQLDSISYYKRYESYFISYFNAADHLINEFRQRYRHVAILQILIDSYAHNISAHSLAALQWFFRQRAFPEKKDERYRALQGEFDPLLLSPRTNLDRETYFLMRFMWEKGAYWSGLIRDNQFGGKISSLFSVLWYDFINNPLYLGTIAFSEGIQKINVDVSILKREYDEEEVFFRKKIILNGTFATIDLTKVPRNFVPEKSSSSQFIIPGKQFKKFEDKLKKFRAFFPGGVVGRHAFFTILENEIRNVKHYTPEVQAEMQKNGLTINISIEEDTYKKQEKEKERFSGEYYKIGVCLEHQTFVTKKLVEDTLSKLEEDIIGPDNRAKLGGIYQDKICAAMLLNNTFISAQDNETIRGERYYPWVKLGFRYESMTGLKNDSVEEIEISHRKYFAPAEIVMQEAQSQPNLIEAYASKKSDFVERHEPGGIDRLVQARKVFDNKFSDSKGYYKKIFHIWKGEREFEVDDSFGIRKGIENLSRFMFLSVSSDKIKLRNQIRAMGLFRLLPKAQQPSSSKTGCWNRWIRLLKGDKECVIQFLLPQVNEQGKSNRKKSRRIAQLHWDGEQAHYRTTEDIINRLRPDMTQKNIYLIHGGEGPKIGIASKECRYRSQGMFVSFFCNGQNPAFAKMDSEYAAELFEIFDTRISIFDNRLAERLIRVDKNKLSNDLSCHVYTENEDEWRNGQNTGLMKNHFLIVHLSFIDHLIQNHDKYASVGEFIMEEVVGRQKNAPEKYNDIPEHFVVVVTSGRGRADWWDDIRQFEKDNREKLPRPITSFVTFKPIEVLSVAVENALTMGDDIELKYRLVKTLFGS